MNLLNLVINNNYSLSLEKTKSVIKFSKFYLIKYENEK